MRETMRTTAVLVSAVLVTAAAVSWTLAPAKGEAAVESPYNDIVPLKINQRLSGQDEISIVPPSMGTGPPPPPDEAQTQHNAVHWAGTRTGTSNRGVYARITVTDPAVPHDGSCAPSYNCFVYSRVMAHTESSKYIQIGWAEVTGGPNVQYVTVATHTNPWMFFTNYALTPGQTIDVAVAYNGGTNWRAELYWNGAWTTLYSQDMGQIDLPYASQQNEIATLNGVHFNVPQTNFFGTQIYTSGAWRLWTNSYPTSVYSDFPYCTTGHFSQPYWSWYVHTHTSGSNC